MSDLLSYRLTLLAHPEQVDLLRHCRHGLEKESLRVDSQGNLSLSGHPRALGSTLTHPQITTDYSEALLEFITDAHEDARDTLRELDDIHRFTYSRLDHEQLWTHSMPCALPAEAQIPIAEYGSSYTGRLKHIYRQGLAVRYGKAMQCIAGIHYNFSLPEALWPLLRDANETRTEHAWQSACYVALIRNFRRYSWLLMYLFGASPALHAPFLAGRAHDLDTLDADTLYLPWATSLRMSDLGYQNNAQDGLTPCYDSLDSYLHSLRQAVSTPYAPYQAIGTQNAAGEWIQLNTNILQIENEYYSTIRPKRVAHSGERPIQALGARGVQYIEVRCLDLDPFLPLGIDLTTSRFLDAFLLYCALNESPLFTAGECSECTENFALTVRQGRKPGVQLRQKGQPIALVDWGHELLERIAACAAHLDSLDSGTQYRDALDAQRAKLNDASLTPSAQVLACLRDESLSFHAFALRQSERHAAYFRQRPLAAEQETAFIQTAEQSLQTQQVMEARNEGEFADFLRHYVEAITPMA